MKYKHLINHFILQSVLLFPIVTHTATISPTDTITTIASGFSNPSDITIDSSGNLYVIDFAAHIVQKIDTQTGIASTIAGTPGINGYAGDGGLATMALLNYPNGLAVDKFGNIYITDTDNQIIRKIDKTTGIISRFAGTPGVYGYAGDGGLAIEALLSFPNNIAVDTSGNIYIVDNDNTIIRIIDTSGIISTVAGTPGIIGYSGDGDSATKALFWGIQDVIADKDKNLYITDAFNGIIRKVDGQTGIINTFAGTPEAEGFAGDGGPAVSALLSYPRKTVLDPSGNLYIADAGNYVIRKVDSAGIINTFAGTPGVFGYSGDGSPANLAQFTIISSLALNSSATSLFILDAFAYVIREIKSSLQSQFPIIGPIIAPSNPQKVCILLHFQANFSYQNINESHSAIWNWGDSTSSLGIVTESNGIGLVKGDHIYKKPGIYTVTLSVTNNMGDTGISIYNYVVIIKPDCKAVIGKGTIITPQGSYVADPSNSRESFFNISATYHLNYYLPSGKTVFILPGIITFNSTRYDWLIIDGASAKLRGEGIINGRGKYGFILNVTDVHGRCPTDRFRIKIWDKCNVDSIIYDNQMGESEFSDAGSKLRSGSITIRR